MISNHPRPVVTFGILLTVALGVAAGLSSCGSKKRSSGGGAHAGPIETAFIQASAASGVPVRYLMATAFQESALEASHSSAPYGSTDDQAAQTFKGLKLSQTAFGLTAAQLGLEGKPEAEDLIAQIHAYAAFLRGRVAGLNLSKNPSTTEEKARWIWEIAQAQREGNKSGRRNVRVVYAQEMIRLLNQGFLWQDKASGEQVKIQKEAPLLKVQDFPADQQTVLQLDTMRAEVSHAVFFPLGATASGNLENHPTRIEVIHCPLNLSACLEMQTLTADGEAHLGAHYIIPEDDLISDRALQVARHEDVVLTTATSGSFVTVQDAIIVMLVGNSGRYVRGVRSPASPTWLTNRQLKLMGWIIDDVCTKLADDDGVNREACMAVGGTNGIKFWRQEGDVYQWGDIADFDETIFQGYVASAGGLQGETAFEFAGERRQFAAGEKIPLKLLFQPRAKLLEIDQLVRCADQRVVWAPLTNEQVLSVTQKVIEKQLYDSGPNGNGEQFFRARVYGDGGVMMGWAVDHVYLQNFQKSAPVVAPKYCLRNGN